MQQDGSDQYQEDSSNNQFLQTQNKTMKRDDTCKPYYLTSKLSDTNCISKQFIYVSTLNTAWNIVSGT